MSITADELVLGGSVLLNDVELGVQNVEARIVEIKRNHLKPGDTVIILASRNRRLTDLILKGQQKQIKSLQKGVKLLQTPPGGPGTPPSGPPSSAPTITLSSVTTSNVPFTTATVSPGVVSVKFAVSTTAFPTAATVRLASADTTPPFAYNGTDGLGGTLTPGFFIYVSAFAYDNNGIESALATLRVGEPYSANGTVAVPLALSGSAGLARLYWRVQGSLDAFRYVSGGGAPTAYSAMAFRDSSGNTIAASGGIAIESDHAGTTAAANLFDGNDSTIWKCSDLTAYIPWAGYHFASPVAVSQIGLQKTSTMSGGLAGAPATLAEVQFSTDGLTWFPLALIAPSLALTANDTMVWFSFAANSYVPRTSFGSHAYWRVIGSESGLIQTFAAYTAMAFRDASGSTITVSGGSTIESGHTSTFAASNLFDGNDATFWESGSSLIPYSGYHFGSAVEVMQIGLQKAATASMDNSSPAPLALFQFSDDGVTWITVAVADAAATMTANNTMYWFDFAGGL